MSITSNRLREPKSNKISFRVDTYSTKRFRTDVFSEKNQKYITIYSNPENHISVKKGESLLEMRLHILLEHEQQFIAYDYQSTPPNNDGKSKPLIYRTEKDVSVEWTPDVYGIFKHSDKKYRDKNSESNLEKWIIEVKPLKIIYKNFQKFENKFSQAKEFCKDKGWKFYVFTDSHIIDSFRVDNLLDLKSQIGFHSKECINQILSCFSENKIWTTIQLQEKLSKTPYNFTKNTILSSTFTLIYYNKLYIDLDAEFTIESEITNDPSIYIPLNEWFERYDWKIDIGKKETENTLNLIDKKELTQKQKQKLERNKNIIKDYRNGINYKEIMKKYGIKSDRTIYHIVSRYDPENPEKSLLRKGGSGRSEKILFEIEYHPKKRPIFLDKHFKEVINEIYEINEESTFEDCWKAYIVKKRFETYDAGLIQSKNASFKKLKEALGEKLVSKHIFMKELNKYTDEFRGRVLIKRKGIKKALKSLRNVTGTTPFANYIGQICQIDHTPADIIGLPYTMYANRKKNTKSTIHMDRATITVIIDVYTRVIVGYCIRYRKPSRESAFLAIRRMVIGNVNPNWKEEDQKKTSSIEKIIHGLKSLVQINEKDKSLLTQEQYKDLLREIDPKDGSDGLRKIGEWWDSIRVMPRILHVDNGKDLISEDIRKLTKKYGVARAVRPVGGSQYGGIVERVLQTLNRHAFQSVPGLTKGTIEKRGDYKSEKKAILTFEQIEALFLLATLRYHVRIHKKLNLPPIEVWHRAIERGDNLSSIITEEEMRRFAYDTLPTVVRSYSQHKGISINDIYYNYDAYESLNPSDKSWAALFAKYKNRNKKIEVRIDSSDIRYVWWWNEQIGQAIRVWATSIKLGDRIYGRNKLKRLPPINIHQFDDFKNYSKYKRGFDIFEYYEEIENSFDNVIWTVKNTLPRTRQKREKTLMRDVETQRIAVGELVETEGDITGNLPKKEIILSKNTNEIESTKEVKFDDIEMEFDNEESKINNIFEDIELSFDQQKPIKKAPTRKEKHIL